MAYLAVGSPPGPPILTSPPLMKLMPSKKREGLKINTDLTAPTPGNDGAIAKEPIHLDEIQTHLERLREVSTVAGKLFALLGEQITIVSSTAPVQRGHKIVRSHPTPVSSG